MSGGQQELTLNKHQRERERGSRGERGGNSITRWTDREERTEKQKESNTIRKRGKKQKAVKVKSKQGGKCSGRRRCWCSSEAQIN